MQCALLFEGENGEGVVIDKEKLSPENKTKYDSGWQNNAFNQFASDMISFHRSLPDIRDEGFVAVCGRDTLNTHCDCIKSNPCTLNSHFRDLNDP